jgi:hypothetical protein
MLLNIDRPNRKATLHTEGCVFVPKPLGTAYKPIGELGRDGGWFTVESAHEAEALAAEVFPAARFAECESCC